MVKNLITLNRGNSTIQKNQAKLHFDKPVNFSNKTLSLVFLSIPFSNYNIKAEYNNNTFNYNINGVSYPVVIPDGYYTPSQLLEFLRYTWDAAGHYLLDASGKKIYYLTWSLNISYYAYTLVSTNMPTVLPGGWTDPSGLIDGNGYAWQLEILNNDFGKILGYSQGIYPNNPVSPGTLPVSYVGGAYAVNSNITPQVDYATSVVLSCNLVDNNIMQTNEIFSYIPQTSYGSYIVERPNIPFEQKLTDGNFSDFIISFHDQEGRPLEIRDTDITMMFQLSDLK